MRQRTEIWFDQALRRTSWHPQRQMVALATLGFFIALLLGALYLSQVAADVGVNRHLTDRLAERDELERVNEQLRANIAAWKNVPRLYERAVALGFAPVAGGQIEYLIVPGYDPDRADTVAPRAEEIVEDTIVYDETFTAWLERQWRALRDRLSGE